VSPPGVHAVGAWGGPIHADARLQPHPTGDESGRGLRDHVVRGAHDPIVTPEWAEAVACLLPRSRLVVIPGAAHAVPYSAPVELGRVIEAFLTVMPGQPPSSTS
jgi:pimeloyl-ACP methyl ester carboxylesterase